MNHNPDRISCLHESILYQNYPLSPTERHCKNKAFYQWSGKSYGYLSLDIEESRTLTGKNFQSCWIICCNNVTSLVRLKCHYRLGV